MMFHMKVIDLYMSKQPISFQLCINIMNEAPGALIMPPLRQLYTCLAATGHTLHIRKLHQK